MASGMLRMLVLVLAFAATNGLKVFVTSSRPAVRCYTATMALPKMEDARSLSTEDIEKEIATAKKVRGAIPTHRAARASPPRFDGFCRINQSLDRARACR